MYFKADKSRSIVIVRGKSMNNTVLRHRTINSLRFHITFIHSVPVKFLGQIINGSLTDRNSIDEFQQILVIGLNTINKSSFKCTQKLWILQHLLIPWIQWSLLKWLNIDSSTTDISFYSLISPWPLPIKSLTFILKSSKVVGIYFFESQRIPWFLLSPLVLKMGTGKQHQPLRLMKQC